ncbi:MAG: hypothetical protein K2H58_01935, partial [Paramuribaculum sp.]|nr:hypothetical protein [Paramuribaculum sp.]
MKKLLLVVTLLFMGIGASVNVNAQQSKEYKKQQAAYQKDAEKVAKKQAKELKKQKWEYSGTLPLEMALTNFYLETEDFGGTKKGIDHE